MVRKCQHNLAIARSNASDVCRGDAPVLALRYKTGDGILATSGVQLAIARSKASDECRGDAPVLAQKYKTGDASHASNVILKKVSIQGLLYNAFHPWLSAFFCGCFAFYLLRLTSCVLPLASCVLPFILVHLER